MTAALDLPTLGRSLYSELLLPANGPYNLAPFPPVHRNQLDCGTIFTFTQGPNGTSGIRTFHVQMVFPEATRKLTFVARRPRRTCPSDTAVECPSGWGHFSVDGSSCSLLTARSQTEPGLVRYRAEANRSAAILIFSTEQCRRYILADGGIDAYPQRRSQAQALFDQGYLEVCHITEVWTTNRWAADLRTEQTPNVAEYTASTIPHGQFAGAIAPNFQFNHNSESGHVRHALDHGLPEYTIVAKYESVQQRGLGRYAPWVVPFMQYSLVLGQVILILKEA